MIVNDIFKSYLSGMSINEIVAAPFAEFNAIRDKARSFLLRTEM